jgi:hypothetical protein
MVLLDLIVQDTYTEKLKVPEGLQVIWSTLRTNRHRDHGAFGPYCPGHLHREAQSARGPAGNTEYIAYKFPSGSYGHHTIGSVFSYWHIKYAYRKV